MLRLKMEIERCAASGRWEDGTSYQKAGAMQYDRGGKPVPGEGPWAALAASALLASVATGKYVLAWARGASAWPKNSTKDSGDRRRTDHVLEESRTAVECWPCDGKVNSTS